MALQVPPAQNAGPRVSQRPLCARSYKSGHSWSDVMPVREQPASKYAVERASSAGAALFAIATPPQSPGRPHFENRISQSESFAHCVLDATVATMLARSATQRFLSGSTGSFLQAPASATSAHNTPRAASRLSVAPDFTLTTVSHRRAGISRVSAIPVVEAQS